MFYVIVGEGDQIKPTDPELASNTTNIIKPTSGGITMSKPKIENLNNNHGSDIMAVLFKTKNTESDGSVKSGYYAGTGDTLGTDDYDIPSKDDDYDLYAFTAAGSFRIYYDNKSNGECHVHYGSDRVTVASDAKIELEVQQDGSLVID